MFRSDLEIVETLAGRIQRHLSFYQAKSELNLRRLAYAWFLEQGFDWPDAKCAEIFQATFALLVFREWISPSTMAEGWWNSGPQYPKNKRGLGWQT